MTSIVGHFFLFTLVAIGGLIVPLIIGRFVRPKLPTTEKDSIYECGEPTIGSSYIQFDLRFYVVALLFIIFDVEVAFFFPWAMVYGTATQLADPALRETHREALSRTLLGDPGAATVAADTASTLAITGFVDILVFFGVLLVGFAYVWKRGDLDWVRAVAEQAKQAAARPRTPPPVEPPTPSQPREPVGV